MNEHAGGRKGFFPKDEQEEQSVAASLTLSPQNTSRKLGKLPPGV